MSNPICSLCGDGRYAVVAWCGNYPACGAQCCTQCLAPSGVCVDCDREEERYASQSGRYSPSTWALARILLDGAKVGGL